MNFIKNLLVGVICIVIFIFGYYFLSQSDSDFSLSSSAVNSKELISRTEVFIKRRATLDAMNLDTELYVDDRFSNLRSYTTPVPPQSVGRNNIFASPQRVSTTRTVPVE